MELAAAKLDDGALSRLDRLWLEFHLLMCVACRTCASQMKAIDRMARRLAGDWPSSTTAGPSLSAEARRRINGLIRNSPYNP